MRPALDGPDATSGGSERSLETLDDRAGPDRGPGPGRPAPAGQGRLIVTNLRHIPGAGVRDLLRARPSRCCVPGPIAPERPHVQMVRSWLRGAGARSGRPPAHRPGRHWTGAGLVRLRTLRRTRVSERHVPSLFTLRRTAQPRLPSDPPRCPDSASRGPQRMTGTERHECDRNRHTDREHDLRSAGQARREPDGSDRSKRAVEAGAREILPRRRKRAIRMAARSGSIG